MNQPAMSRPQQQVIGDIRAFLLAADALPSPRGTALKLVEIARDPDAALNDIVQVVKSDPALTGFVLRAAAAARFHAMGGALDLRRAVHRLGMNEIRTHALTLSLIGQRGRVRCEGFDYTRFWIGALHTGILSEALALRCMRRPDGDAFALGLLADIGRLAFATASPLEYSRVLARAKHGGIDCRSLERQTFGFDHYELSSVLLADWQLPTALADIVYWQRDPEGGGFEAGSTRHRLASVLQLARCLSDATLDADGSAEPLASATLRAAILELDAGEMRNILADSLPALRDWAALVGLPVPALRP